MTDLTLLYLTDLLETFLSGMKDFCNGPMNKKVHSLLYETLITLKSEG